jgi:hypothetical protein
MTVARDKLRSSSFDARERSETIVFQFKQPFRMVEGTGTTG